MKAVLSSRLATVSQPHRKAAAKRKEVGCLIIVFV